ncbi:hypothetical protein DN752_21160 [Echinicola strongylocentroti]|uniref:Uncharacterized protein n=1 Tax=Echinicola strongylocentroti TaxID=1795355 RepID=A0A2Z4IQ85_9BACT|nr:hypothetical protein [Echinicola strongylocentroti]AWW32453.1 hypothetical protein DN752_21160 [Echinicola strongylocentroti]
MEKDEKSPLQLLRSDIQKSCPALADHQIIRLCEDYGIQYDIPDANTLRIFMLLASAEQKLLEDEQ